MIRETLPVIWTRYKSFFDLWRAHKFTPQLIYVIGEEHHCYVGSIGCDGGSGAMAKRYQWQYVRLAMSIFGRGEEAGQVAYAGLFDSPDLVHSLQIYKAEAFVQRALVAKIGRDKVLFRPIQIPVTSPVVVCTGDVPAFLR